MSISEVVGAVFGVAGTLLLAVPGVPAQLGFACFVMSNLGWIVYAMRGKALPLLLQYIVFLVISLVGLWNWWLQPLLRGAI